MDVLIECERSAGDGYQALLSELLTDWGLVEHRRRVVDTTMACLAASDALYPPLVWEHVREEYQGAIEDFQVMRDDFESVGSRYQDIFELASRTLAYLGLILNLRHRGDPCSWADGKSRTINKILNKTPAFGREFIANELPHARSLLAKIDRNTRNRIGHRLVAYDFTTQTLIDDHGNRANYLAFLIDYLEAVRATQYLMTVIEKLTLDSVRARTPQREIARLPIID